MLPAVVVAMTVEFHSSHRLARFVDKLHAKLASSREREVDGNCFLAFAGRHLDDELIIRRHQIMRNRWKIDRSAHLLTASNLLGSDTPRIFRNVCAMRGCIAKRQNAASGKNRHTESAIRVC